MKLYTGTGDKGFTFLLTGCKVRKNDPLVKSYGKADTLISFLGCAKALFNKNNKKFKQMRKILEEIQLTCFKAITDLASSKIKNYQENIKNNNLQENKIEKFEKISEKDIKRIESLIDEIWQTLPPIENFVIPGDNLYSSFLHICRAICRETESLIADANEQYDINPFVLVFFNRLSDLLFSLAVKTDFLINKKLSLIKGNKKIF